MSETCPICGGRVRVTAGEEGTNSYVSEVCTVEAHKRTPCRHRLTEIIRGWWCSICGARKIGEADWIKPGRLGWEEALLEERLCQVEQERDALLAAVQDALPLMGHANECSVVVEIAGRSYLDLSLCNCPHRNLATFIEHLEPKD